MLQTYIDGVAQTLETKVLGSRSDLLTTKISE